MRHSNALSLWHEKDLQQKHIRPTDMLCVCLTVQTLKPESPLRDPLQPRPVLRKRRSVHPRRVFLALNVQPVSVLCACSKPPCPLDAQKEVAAIAK